MRLIRRISQRWNRQRITQKFGVALGLFLGLILLVSSINYLALNAVRNKTETAILTSMRIQRIVLEMNADLEKARRLQRDFFLHYPQMSFSEAREVYARGAQDQIAQVITLSTELKNLIAGSDASEALRRSRIDLNLYLSASERYAQTFSEAEQLFAELADDTSGVQTQLSRESAQLNETLSRIGNADWVRQYYVMQLYEKDYLITRRRSSMQSSLNTAAELRRSIQNTTAVDPDLQRQALDHLTAYQTIAQRVVDLEAAMRSKFNDFDLQAQSLDPISEGLITLAANEVDQALAKVEQANRLAMIALGLTALVGFGLAGLIAQVLNNSITRNIVKLTAAAAALQAGDLSASAEVDSQDELGNLGRTFNRMAAELQTSFGVLQASEARFRDIFVDSPISLWEEDGSALKEYLDELRSSGISDWRAFFRSHPEAVQRCVSLIKVVDVNKATLELLQYPDKAALLDGLAPIFGENAYAIFSEELIALAEGATVFEAEATLCTYHDDEVEVSFRLSLVPGYEDTWAKTLVSLTNITERKRIDMALAQQAALNASMADLSQKLLLATTVNEVADLTLEMACSLTGSPYGFIGHIDPLTNELISLTREPEPPADRQPDQPAGVADELGQLLGRALHNQHSILCNPGCDGDAFLQITGRVKRFLAAQGLHGEVLVGEIGLANAGQDYSQHDLVTVERLASILALGIRHKQAQESLNRQVERLRALRSIDQTIASNFEQDITLNLFLDEVVQQLEVDAAAVWLLNPFMVSLDLSAWNGFRSDRYQDLHLRAGSGYAGRAIMEQRMIQILDRTAGPGSGDPDEEAFLAEEQVISLNYLPLIAKGQVLGVLSVYQRRPHKPNVEWINFLETLAGQAAILVDNAQLIEGLHRSRIELQLAYDSTLEGWSRALDLRDDETEGHSERVADFTVRLARAFGLREEEIMQIWRGALLHDIGKMGVPDSILHKPGKLTDDEWVVMRKHPVYAFKMLAPIKYLQPALDIPYCHHEHWDGSGYPRGLKGEQIPLAARIFALVDVWDALNSDRPYRLAWPREQVFSYILSLRGRQFDPQVVDVFMSMVQEQG